MEKCKGYVQSFNFQKFGEAIVLNNITQSIVPHNPSQPVSLWLVYCPVLCEAGLT